MMFCKDFQFYKDTLKCRYNFKDGAFTDLRNGQTFKAGESIDNRKPIP